MRYQSTFILVMSLTFMTGCGEGLQQRLAADSELEQTENSSNSELEPAMEVPDNIPFYPNAQLVDQQIEEEDSTGTLQWVSSDRINQIIQFYEQELSGEGWEIGSPFAEGEETKMEATSSSLELKVIVSESQTSEAESTIRLDYQKRPPQAAQETTTETTPKEDQEQASPPQPEKETEEEEPVTREGSSIFNDLAQTPEPLRGKVKHLAKLGILTPVEAGKQQFAPNEPVTRRTFARWLFEANNTFYSDRASEQIRPVSQTDTPAFTDIPPSDPDFPMIQGLAEAGLISSRLTGDDTATRFRPDQPITRQTLLLWKVPLDTRRPLPSANLKTIEDNWGFRDASAIDSEAFGAIVADLNNEENSNLRRVYGYTQLLQPQKAVTRAEAATALWSFGTEGKIITAKELLSE